MWCIPPKANAEFVWRMEDVLEVYKRPYDPLFPVVCMDETSKQLVGDSRPAEPMKPGKYSVRMLSTNARARAICSSFSNRCAAGVEYG